jgi:hypothetical protein
LAFNQSTRPFSGKAFPCYDQRSDIRQQRDGFEVILNVVWQRVDGTVDDMGIPETDNQRVSIRSGPRDPADANAAIRARDVLDQGGLAERLPNALSDHAPEQVRRSARNERHDDGNGPRRIGLRPRDPRHDREHGGARDQLQKLPAVGKVS